VCACVMHVCVRIFTAEKTVVRSRDGDNHNQSKLENHGVHLILLPSLPIAIVKELVRTGVMFQQIGVIFICERCGFPFGIKFSA